LKNLKRIRGKLDTNSESWISLMNTEDGSTWAEQILKITEKENLKLLQDDVEELKAIEFARQIHQIYSQTKKPKLIIYLNENLRKIVENILKHNFEIPSKNILISQAPQKTTNIQFCIFFFIYLIVCFSPLIVFDLSSTL